MIILTTPSIEGREIEKYLGVVSGNAVLGTNIFRDIFAGIKDIVGGRMGQYEDVLEKAQELAIEEMKEKAEKLGANAIIGVNISFNTIGQASSMLMVNVVGTAVLIK
ncbi:MAG TPA: heavy metal-binding domain-containing protein [Ignavibacteriales bacterium]|jgi:uncharacterized protein YbjQ (UPF0145 family)|nr:heavy metal-binding domain-containing protein [Ignavibacteriales bacterium]